MSLECLSGGNCSAPVQGFPLKKKEDIHVMNQKHPVLYHMTYCFKMGRGYNTPTFICTKDHCVKNSEGSVI